MLRYFHLVLRQDRTGGEISNARIFNQVKLRMYTATGHCKYYITCVSEEFDFGNACCRKPMKTD